MINAIFSPIYLNDYGRQVQWNKNTIIFGYEVSFKPLKKKVRDNQG